MFCRGPDMHYIFKFRLSISIASLKKVAKRPRRRYYNAVGVKDVLVACKDVEVSKNGEQVDWDTLIAHYDKPKETEHHESDDDHHDTELEHQQEGRKLSDGQDEKLGMFTLSCSTSD